MVKVIKATPVASFIILFWVMFSGDALAIIIALLMVMPIIWQNLIDGYNSIDHELVEVCDAYEVAFFKRLRILVLPALKKYFIPALITASGLAWKSEIAAEIIAYTKNSIGQAINDAKYDFDMPTVFAWSVVIIALSVLFEFGLKRLLARCK
jgi:NitT/TauT family transport system permease protein